MLYGVEGREMSETDIRDHQITRLKDALKHTKADLLTHTTGMSYRACLLHAQNYVDIGFAEVSQEFEEMQKQKTPPQRKP